jgi:site-specific DNA recombinase
MGGFVPLGYDVRERRVVINETEAETVRYIFRRYEELGGVRLLREDLNRIGIVSKRRTSARGIQSGDRPFSRGALYALLANPIYVGEIRHKNLCHRVSTKRYWSESYGSAFSYSAANRQFEIALINLESLSVHSPDDCSTRAAMVSRRATLVKAERRYRYYVSRNLITGTAGWWSRIATVQRQVWI